MFFGLFGSTKKAGKKSKKVVKKLVVSKKAGKKVVSKKATKKVVKKLTGRRKIFTKKGGAVRSGSVVQGMKA